MYLYDVYIYPIAMAVIGKDRGYIDCDRIAVWSLLAAIAVTPQVFCRHLWVICAATSDVLLQRQRPKLLRRQPIGVCITLEVLLRRVPNLTKWQSNIAPPSKSNCNRIYTYMHINIHVHTYICEVNICIYIFFAF